MITTKPCFPGSLPSTLLIKQGSFQKSKVRVTTRDLFPGFAPCTYVLVDTAQYVKDGTWWSEADTSGTRCHCFSDEWGEETSDLRREPCRRKSHDPAAGPYDLSVTKRTDYRQNTHCDWMRCYSTDTSKAELFIHIWKRRINSNPFLRSCQLEKFIYIFPTPSDLLSSSYFIPFPHWTWASSQQNNHASLSNNPKISSQTNWNKWKSEKQCHERSNAGEMNQGLQLTNSAYSGEALFLAGWLHCTSPCLFV